MPLFQLVQIIYWMALATWFGGVLFLAISAPIIFRTVGESNPVLPHVLSVNLEGQHSTLLAGTIVGNLIHRLMRVELACAAALAVTIAVQWAKNWQEHPAAMVRTGLFVTAVLLAAYDALVIWPQISKHRRQYIDHADEPEIANPAREQFDRYHRRSVLLLMILLTLLLGMIVFSTSIKAPVSATIFTI